MSIDHTTCDNSSYHFLEFLDNSNLSEEKGSLVDILKTLGCLSGSRNGARSWN